MLLVLEEVADWSGRQTHGQMMPVHCEKGCTWEGTVQHQGESGQVEQG